MERNRVEIRKDWAIKTRVTQCESDLDDNDSEIAKLRKSVDRLVWACMGAVITFATSAALLALNLGLVGHK